MVKLRDDSERLREMTVSWILDEAVKWSLFGVKVKIDGQFYSGRDSEIIENVKENNYYMENYVSDNNGKIVQVEFDRL
ncbi:hypothetical protein KQI69_10195 [Eubacterium sp. MSJ-13]|uniref:hypothetical protein n=1 Tax=Eubacterium sp. MSJ-13 TaxID=2841513 RepID=UPI001C11C9AC|nr:hypothetical protein [Eubacterium sp. MSJ-13]MBU5479573.1 hypothetical protein [Eubacterium sp. MSJ-13]